MIPLTKKVAAMATNARIPIAPLLASFDLLSVDFSDSFLLAMPPLGLIQDPCNSEVHTRGSAYGTEQWQLEQRNSGERPRQYAAADNYTLIIQHPTTRSCEQM